MIKLNLLYKLESRNFEQIKAFLNVLDKSELVFGILNYHSFEHFLALKRLYLTYIQVALYTSMYASNFYIIIYLYLILVLRNSQIWWKCGGLICNSCAVCILIRNYYTRGKNSSLFRGFVLLYSKHCEIKKTRYF